MHFKFKLLNFLKSIIPTLELRQHLIEMIQKTDNENILHKINRLLEIEAESIYELIKNQINAINDARLQFKNDLIIENVQAKKKLKNGQESNLVLKNSKCSKTNFKYWIKRNNSKIHSRKLNIPFVEVVELNSMIPSIGKLTNDQRVRIKVVDNYLITYEKINNLIFTLTIWDSR